MPIFDQGYQHWNGTLSGHAWRWLAITRHGVRIGMKMRSLRFVLLLSLLPAMTLAAAIATWGLIERKSVLVQMIAGFLVGSGILNRGVVTDPLHYRIEIWTLCYSLFLSSELTLSMILVLLVGPDLISQDLRFNALPLYLSRPLRRIDYFLGKLGVIAAFLGLVTVVPCLLAYALGLLFTLDITILRDTFGLLLAAIGYGVVIILSAGMLILALSSLSRNSRYVALFWLVLWIVSNIFSYVLQFRDQVARIRPCRTGRTSGQSLSKKCRGDRGFGQKRLRGSGRNGQFQPSQEVLNAQLEAAKTNWRPLVSYTANLDRIGRQLLGTDACWKSSPSWSPPLTEDVFSPG